MYNIEYRGYVNGKVIDGLETVRSMDKVTWFIMNIDKMKNWDSESEIEVFVWEDGKLIYEDRIKVK